MIGKKHGGDIFIVDNSDSDWKALDYLREWTEIANQFDVASGYFEIGALLALDGHWQKLDKLRVLMGAEVTKRTRQALLDGLTKSITAALDASLEREKENDEFLKGAPAIVEALRQGRIECRVYTKKKFHAKAYITHSRLSVVGSAALVGSSNFTSPGLTQNVELNVQLRREVEILQEWYEQHWKEAVDITPEIFQIIERHTRDYTPFEIYAKSLQEYFRNREMTADEWELAGPDKGGSHLFHQLDKYQQEGYQALMKIAFERGYSGAFLCDGVGLGKTFVGMMLIERLVVKDRKRVVLLVPKAAREPVWEKALQRYLPQLDINGVFSNFVIFNHSDLLRGGKYQQQWESVKQMADVIVIDEAHHFRNPGTKGEGSRSPSRYRRLYEIAEGKTLFLLTATPINNRLTDLQHLIELFSHRQTNYFKAAPLGIHSLPGHFRKLEKELERAVLGREGEEIDLETNQVEAGRVLAQDALFRELVVQRSRAYVKESQLQQGGTLAVFPKREDPQVADYSIRKTYGRLLSLLEKAFSKEKALFSLAVYYPLAYYKGSDTSIDPLLENRQKQVVALIRTQFLKRFESSAYAFEQSCKSLLVKLLAFVTKHSHTPTEQKRFDRWKAMHAESLGSMRNMQRSIFTDQLDLQGDQPLPENYEDQVSEELLAEFEELQRAEYKVDEILNETYLDMDQLIEFLDELKKFKPSHDDKLKALIKLLKSHPQLKEQKVLLFTEFMDTARYLKEQLEEHKIEGVDEVDGSDSRNRGEVIRRFAPYYNESSIAELAVAGLPETRVLISTDVLSEGLNLQDATRLINYDLHWNPVRLMQRIGRIDRRLNPDIEKRILADHPEQKEVRGTAVYWNFLPPDELDELLQLYQRVSHKTLRISKVFGIEGKKLLKPDDDFAALKDFLHNYEGEKTEEESLHLEYQRLCQAQPDLPAHLATLPGRVFSGKKHPALEAHAVFFCYALPGQAADVTQPDAAAENSVWTEEAGSVGWYLYDLATEQVVEDPIKIVKLIRCVPDTPRQRAVADETLAEIRAKVEKHLKNSYLKKVQAPAGVKPVLKAWMELV
jgi:superfamily II DNA or RNA helicase